MFMGRFDVGINENQRAQELDPLSPETAGIWAMAIWWFGATTNP
jgi:hypothetical protein